MPSRGKRVALLVVITAALLEAVLQFGYLGLWLFHPGDEEPDIVAGERVVLCVGDSFTYGMGATS